MVALAAIAVSSTVGCKSTQQTRAEEVCVLHNVPLKEAAVPIVYGEPSFRPGYFEAQQENFPFARTRVLGGCVVSWNSPNEQDVLYCTDCRAARNEWIAEHLPAMSDE